MKEKNIGEVFKSIVDDLNGIQKHLASICDSLQYIDFSDENAKDVTPETERKEEVEKVSSTKTSEVTKESLDSMPYHALKKYAKSIGVSAVGSRDEITVRILGVDLSPEPEEEDSKPEITVIQGKSEEPEELEIISSSEDDNLYEEVVEAVKDMTDKEIIEYLKECGISAKGKRESLIQSIIKGVKDGIIDFEDSEEDIEEEESEDTEEVTSSEDSEEEEDCDTPERIKALEVNRDEVYNSIESGDISREDLEEWMVESFPEISKSKVKKMKTEELAEKYIEVSSMFIDDEGNSHDVEECYEIRGVYYCCGTPLEEDEDGNFVCSCCESSYSAG